MSIFNGVIGAVIVLAVRDVWECLRHLLKEKKVIGSITLKDSSTRTVRMCTKGGVADNKSYVSSQTGGKEYSVEGNLSAVWQLSIHAKNDVPSPGQVITMKLKADARSYTMIINSAFPSPDYKSCIILCCSADSATSYHD